jgi:ankyrin repeat protein
LSNNDHGKVDLEKYTEFMQVLIEAGADLHAVDHQGNNIFHDAIGWNVSIWSSWPAIRSGVKAMVNLGVPTSAINHQGRTALHIAAAVEDRGVSREINETFTSRLEFCLQKHLGLDVNVRDHEGITPLHLAATTCEVNVWNLIQAGADVQARTLQGRTALHFAAEAGKCNIVDLLVRQCISQSTSLDSQNLKGRTALHEAARAGRPESVKILLNGGAFSNVQDKRGRTPLHAAAEFEEVPPARVTQRSHDAKDPLIGGRRKFTHYDEPKKGFEEMQMMISRKNDPKCIRQVVWLLLDAGSDATQLDANEHTASDVAVMLGNRVVVEECSSEMATSHSFPGAVLKPLDPVGENLLSTINRNLRDTIKHMDFGDDPFRFLERLISHGDKALLEEVVAANMPLQSLVKADGSSPLHLIARSGLTGLMKVMLPYVQDLQGFKPPLLHVALKRPIWNMEMIRLLIAHGVDINAQYLKPASKRDSTKYSQESHQYAAVHVLATGKYWWYPEALQELLKAGANPELINDNGETALQVALAARDPDSDKQGVWCDQTLDVLLEHGANVNIVASETSLTPLNTALESHCGPQVTQKLLDHGADGSFGPKPAIASAIDSLDYASLEILLKAGADPNEVYMSNESKRYEDGPKQETPLQNSACPTRIYGYDPYTDSERGAVISLLLKYGAHPYQPLMDGTTTVLHEIAAINGLLKHMLVDGVDLEQKDSIGRTPLMRSCDLPDYYKRAIETEYASLELIIAGADINIIDSNGSTALHYAIQANLPLTIAKLLEKGAAVNVKDNNGTTPLYYALRLSGPQGITALFDAGANPLDIAPDGRTPLHFLAPLLMQCSPSTQDSKDREITTPDEFTSYRDLYTRCISAGCSPEARDNAGNTPIFAYVVTVKTYGERETEPPLSLIDIKAMFAEHDIFAVNDEGETLLHVVAGREEDFRFQEDGLVLFKCLVEMGLDPGRENGRGASAVDIAAACGNEGILGLFARE